jgi:transketolase
VRGALCRALLELAERDSRVMLLTGDLGFAVLEPFAERFPHRFVNVGVAEQNMVGVATGLAEAGYLPFVYSIATFAALRPYEFIRNGPVLQRLPVRIAGIGGGFEYGTAGPTHHALEDVAVMRALPGLTVLAPADHLQARAALLATWDAPGPVYYRLGKDDRTVVPGLDGRFRLGRAETAREGPDLLLVGMGAICALVAEAGEALASAGVGSTVLVAASLAPPPVEDLAAALARHPVAVAVEAHVVNGGLGSLVAEVIAERDLGCRLVRAGVRQVTHGPTGSQAYHHEAAGLSRDAIVRTALAALEARARPTSA